MGDTLMCALTTPFNVALPRSTVYSSSVPDVAGLGLTWNDLRKNRPVKQKKNESSNS